MISFTWSPWLNTLGAIIVLIGAVEVFAVGDDTVSVPANVSNASRPASASFLTSDAVTNSSTGVKASTQAGISAHAAGGESESKAHVLPRHTWIPFTFSFVVLVKGLCMASNVAFQVSPFPQVRKFEKQNDTGTTDAAPYMCILYGGSQWCFYGIFAFLVTGKSGFLILVYSNFLGAILGAYYIAGFQRNCQDGDNLRKLHVYYRVAAALVTFQVFSLAVLAKQQALFLSGLVSSMCSVLGSISLLSACPTVFRTRCSASINMPLLVVGAGSGCLWIMCGYILSDAWIMVPNSTSLVIQCFLFSLMFYFPRQSDSALSEISPAISQRGFSEEDAEAERLIPAPVSGSPPLTYGSAPVLGDIGGTC